MRKKNETVLESDNFLEDLFDKAGKEIELFDESEEKITKENYLSLRKITERNCNESICKDSEKERINSLRDDFNLKLRKRFSSALLGPLFVSGKEENSNSFNKELAEISKGNGFRSDFGEEGCSSIKLTTDKQWTEHLIDSFGRREKRATKKFEEKQLYVRFALKKANELYLILKKQVSVLQKENQKLELLKSEVSRREINIKEINSFLSTISDKSKGIGEKVKFEKHFNFIKEKISEIDEQGKTLEREILDFIQIREEIVNRNVEFWEEKNILEAELTETTEKQAYFIDRLIIENSENVTLLTNSQIKVHLLKNKLRNNLKKHSIEINEKEKEITKERRQKQWALFASSVQGITKEIAGEKWGERINNLIQIGAGSKLVSDMSEWSYVVWIMVIGSFLTFSLPRLYNSFSKLLKKLTGLNLPKFVLKSEIQKKLDAKENELVKLMRKLQCLNNKGKNQVIQIISPRTEKSPKLSYKYKKQQRD
jgi:hypothetical protein